MANTYVLIASNTLTSSAASVTFSSIPNTYTDLVLRVSARASAGGSIASAMSLQLNANTGTVYSATVVRAYESNTPASLRQSNIDMLLYLDKNGSSTTANTFSSAEIYIPNYTSTTNKPISGFSVIENNNATTPSISAVAQLARITSAITSIKLGIGDDSFISGSSFWLYGISKD